jgi:hypothetical protein
MIMIFPNSESGILSSSSYFLPSPMLYHFSQKAFISLGQYRNEVDHSAAYGLVLLHSSSSSGKRYIKYGTYEYKEKRQMAHNE